MSDRVDAPLEPAVSRYHELESLVFNVLYTMVRDNEPPKLQAMIALILEDIQMLSFPWNSKQNIYGLPQLLTYIFNPTALLVYDYTLLTYATWVAVGLLVITWVLMIFVGLSFNRGQFKAVWPLALLRFLSSSVATVLFTSFFEIFLQDLNCTTHNGEIVLKGQLPNTIQCYGSHLLLLIVASIGLILLIPFTIFFNLLYVDPNINSPDQMGKLNGRIDTLYQVVKIFLVLSEELIDNNAARTVIVAVLSVGIAYLFFRFQPFYSMGVNQIRVGILSAAALSSIVCCISSFLTNHGQIQTLGPFIALICTIPLGLMFGYFATPMLLKHIIRRTFANLRARLDAEQGKDAHKSEPKRAYDVPLTQKPSLSWAPDLESSSMSQRPGDLLDRVPSILASRKIKRPNRIFDYMWDVELACRFIHDVEQDEQTIGLMNIVFNAGLELFPKSSELQLIYAYYIATFDENQMEMAIVQMRGEFAALRRSIQDIPGGAVGATRSYVEYSSMEKQAKRSHVAALVALKSFWAYFNTEGATDMGRLGTLLENMHKTEKDASNFYEKLLRRFPKSKSILRMYASFLTAVKNNAELSQQYLNQADEIEAEECRMRLTQSVAKSKQSPFSKGLLSPASRRRQSVFTPQLSSQMPGPSMVVSGHSPADGKGDLESNIHSKLATPSKEKGTTEDYAAEVAVSHSRQGSTRSLNFSTINDILPIQPQHDTKPTTCPETKDGVPLGQDGTTDDVEGTQSSLSDGGSDHEHASEASSTSSNREQLKKKRLRGKIESRLFLPILSCHRWTQFSFLFLVIGAIANFTLAIMFFQNMVNIMERLHDTTKGRTAAMGAVQELRMMMFYAKVNQTQKFDLHSKNLRNICDFYNEFLLPSLEDDHDQDIDILIWDGIVSNNSRVMEPIIRNTYSLSVLISQSVNTVLDFEIETFSSEEINKDPDIRIMMMNIEKIGNALDNYVQDVGKRTFIQKGESDVQILLALFGINAAIIFGMILLLEYMVWKTRKVSFKLLNLLMLVPKRAQKAMIANLDEEIDLLTDANEVDEKQLHAIQNRESQRRMSPLWRARLLYVLGMIITTAFCCTLNVTPLQRLSEGISVATLIVASDSRRYLAQYVSTLAGEVINPDHQIFWRPYEAETLFLYKTSLLKAAHQKLLEGRHINADELTHNRDIIKYTKANPNICLLANGCGDQAFNVSIGFTGQLVSSGLDLLISRYVGEAEKLVHSYEKNGYDDQHFLLMRAILPYILDGLDSVTGMVLDKEIVGAQRSTKIQIIIFGLSGRCLPLQYA
ncbi:hypothetical protein HK102_011643 [Quaeritorhiza haematococci]|nr:hypothetical protein HK102_011643 [Quaeritorhiza haematococci]